jgi:predicted ester cyclase
MTFKAIPSMGHEKESVLARADENVCEGEFYRQKVMKIQFVLYCLIGGTEI